MEKAEKVSFVLSDQVHLDISQWGDAPVVYLNLHENEQTAVEAAKQILPGTGGILLELKSMGERLISIERAGEVFMFDPNRIFSAKGIRDTLEEYGSANELVEQELGLFAEALMEKIRGFHPVAIVALHNTTGEYSLDAFRLGGDFENDTSEVYFHSGTDPADFFFVNLREDYDWIRDAGYSVALQHPDVADDGSLSVYCAVKKIRYINSEARHGHLEEQVAMIRFIAVLLHMANE